MKAIIISKFGGPEVLQVVERELPVHSSKEVLIKVKAFGINRPDVFQRKGNYPAPKGASMDIPGLEVAGIVEECGEDVGRWKVGDEVCALLSGGGYSEYVAVNERHCLPKPENLSFAEAASLPETLFTVWHNVFQRGNLQAGDSILIHGGSGGIGITAIQLASHFCKAVYVTAGSKEKCDECIKLGADLAINYKAEDFEDVLTNTEINVVLDSIGGDYFQKNLNLLSEDGRMVSINAMLGAKVSLNISQIMQKRLIVTGSTLRSRSADFKAQLAEEIERDVWPLIAQEKFQPIVKVFPYSDVVAAHTYLESGFNFGKIVLTWNLENDF
ncbi:MAG TPA: NAD(P)H-quinone oxidoreductase [Sphingobacteriaceae bacterium]|nr:NAD(P)H-quinone oxidoreductase [Sphingobacteriaceae bacterium]